MYTLEEVGDGYLEELIDRCMVQVEKKDHTGMGVKTCRMHDLMRDLCTNKAREESFAQIIDDQSNISIDGSDASRRLVIHPGVRLQYPTFFRKLVSKESKWVEQVQPNLRSLLCLGGILSLSALKSSNFRMLSVLELHVPSGGSNRTLVLGGIGNLIHLRYLFLRGEYAKISLSSSIGNLRNLHTLDIESEWNVIGSVGMISRLIRLRHLLLPYHLSKKNLHDFRIDKLKDIETLENIPASVLIRHDGLNKLTNLRKISIRFDGNHVQDDARRVLGSQIFQSGRLRSLKMYGSIMKPFPSLEPLSSCHSLSKLGLSGNILFQQKLIHLPESLTKLNLTGSGMGKDPMPLLENKLPNLRFLKLSRDAYLGSTMVCSAHGFPKLDTLQLEGFFYLREWIVEKGAMPSLKKLTIENLGDLEMIPQGFEFLTSLKELNISKMTDSFRERLQVKNGKEGEDYYKVKHIPSISFIGFPAISFTGLQ